MTVAAQVGIRQVSRAAANLDRDCRKLNIRVEVFRALFK